MHGQQELQLNVTVDWVALVLNVHKVYSSNFGLVTIYPDGRFSRSFSTHQRKFCDNILH
jgi:hypothetical protein